MSNKQPSKVSRPQSSNSINVLDLIKCDHYIVPPTKNTTNKDKNVQSIVLTTPVVGNTYITNHNTRFLSGQIRLRGRGDGRYPFYLLEMIDNMFGVVKNTVEVCSGSVRGTKDSPCTTVDINPDTKPDIVDDGQFLRRIQNNKFRRWRCDPPYNEYTARTMFGTTLPSTIKLLKAGSRVCKIGSLMFLFLGPKNYQWCPPGVKRIGIILATIVPNNEVRCLNIYYKYADPN
jgi:hypothetical protein